jgi:hypothetical protein
MSRASTSFLQGLRNYVGPKGEPELVKYVKQVYDAQNLWQVLVKGGWRSILDGSLGEQVRNKAARKQTGPSRCPIILQLHFSEVLSRVLLLVLCQNIFI